MRFPEFKGIFALRRCAAVFLLFSFILPFGRPASVFAVEESASKNPAWQVYFSPEGGCTQAIVERLDQARTSVLVQAYSFTSRPIAKALVDAHKRGVRVEVILDESQVLQDNIRANYFAKSGLPVTIDGVHVIAHNKVMVIDEAVVITGSFNFTRAGEVDNAENLLFITDASVAAKYAANWRDHRAHSEPYALQKDISKHRENKKK